MLNKLLEFVKKYRMVQPGDRIICAVSGGADSVAMLFAFYLLAPKLSVTLEAAHFNHCLRGEESDADAVFVKQFCDDYGIPLHMGRGQVVAGKKGLEAAARNARYAFLEGLPGKIATAHTADDNAETLLMHLIRGTGLKGLGGITPVRGNVIRPMLSITREDVLAFLREYNLSWREDSTNQLNLFLRNRVRHEVMPLLKNENPCIARNLSLTALGLREDEQALSAQITGQDAVVSELRQLAPAVRSRWIRWFLTENGVPEPDKEHVTQVERLIFSQKPSARADLPGGVTVTRKYDRLEIAVNSSQTAVCYLDTPGTYRIPGTEYVLSVSVADQLSREQNCFSVKVSSGLCLRTRKSGDRMRLSGGTKLLKKLFIDEKIPAGERNAIPILADDDGVLWVHGFGPNRDRLADTLPALEMKIEKMQTEE